MRNKTTETLVTHQYFKIANKLDKKHARSLDSELALLNIRVQTDDNNLPPLYPLSQPLVRNASAVITSKANLHPVTLLSTPEQDDYSECVDKPQASSLAPLEEYPQTCAWPICASRFRSASQGEDNVHFPYQPEAKTSQYNQISFTCCNEKNDLASFAPPYQHNFGVAILDLPNELLFKVAERLAFRLQNEILALRTVCRRFNEFVLGAIAHSAHTNLATPFTRIAVPFLRLDCEMFLYCSNRSPLSNIVQIVELKLDPNDLFHKFKNKDDDYARNREHYKTLFRLMKKSFGRALEAMTSIDTVILSLRGVNDSDCVLKDQLRVANYVSRLFDSIFGHGRSVNTLGIDGVGANYVGKDLIPYRFIKGTRMHEVLTTVALQLYTRQSPMAHNDLSYWKQFLRCLTRLEKLSLYNCRPKGTDLLLRTRKWKESLDVSSLLEDFTPTLKYIKISKLWFRYDCLDSFLKAISPSLNVLHFDCVGLAPDEETGWLELLKLMRQHLSLAQCNITNSRAGLSYATRQGGWEIVQAYGLWPKDYNMIDMSRYVLREAPCRSRHIEAIEAE